ncbi:MAG: YoaK family protein [Gemmatimonadales bacterium]
MTAPTRPVSPTGFDDRRLVAPLLVLTAATGLVDAVSVLGLGRVFTANMTGNVVFLGFALAGTPGYSAARSLVALAAFLAGAALGGGLTNRTGGRIEPVLHRALFTESGLLAIGGAAALALASDAALQYGLIVITGVAMGLRNAAMRKLAVADLTTTVLTLTLTGLGADSRLAGGASPRRIRRLGATAAMLTGAAIGAVLVLRAGLGPALLLTGGITLLTAVACWRTTRAHSPSSG